MSQFLSFAEQLVKSQEETQDKILKAFQPLIDYFTKPTQLNTDFLKPFADYVKANNLGVTSGRPYHVITKRLKRRFN